MLYLNSGSTNEARDAQRIVAMQAYFEELCDRADIEKDHEIRRICAHYAQLCVTSDDYDFKDFVREVNDWAQPINRLS